MKRNFIISAGVALFLLMASPAFVAHAQDKLPEFPYLSHMSMYSLHDSDDREFDEFTFFDGKEMQTVEGRKYQKRYHFDDDKGGVQASQLQITRNYANAAKGAGGEVLYEGKCDVEGMTGKSCDRIAVLKLIKGQKEVWVEIIPFNSGGGYDLNAIEKEEMKQDVSKKEEKPEPPKVEAKTEPVKPEMKEDISKRDLAGEIKSKGYTTIYVNFDVDKWVIRPESEPVVNQVAQMLQDNPDLSLIIAGHTDSSGTWAHNKTLSENRAGAVLQALVAHGVGAGRLASVGYGQDRPIADNATEEGKARNRRVELVRQ